METIILHVLQTGGFLEVLKETRGNKEDWIRGTYLNLTFFGLNFCELS